MKPSRIQKNYLAKPILKENSAEVALPPATAEQLEQRNKAIKAAFGIFKGKGVFPEDGLEYQLEMRAEWR